MVVLVALFKHMSRFFSILESKYCKTDFAGNYSSFDDIKHGVYLWYYPIKLKHRKRSIDSTLDDFYQNGLDSYNMINELFLEDKTRHIQSLVSGSLTVNPKTLGDSKDEYRVSEIVSEFLTASSVFSKPLYVGKSSPRDEHSGRNLSNRIQEHIDGRSKFSALIERKNENLDLKNFIVKVIDIGKIDQEFFDGEFANKKIDLANYIEIHLINIFKPSYNTLFK